MFRKIILQIIPFQNFPMRVGTARHYHTSIIIFFEKSYANIWIFPMFRFLTKIFDHNFTTFLTRYSTRKNLKNLFIRIELFRFF